MTERERLLDIIASLKRIEALCMNPHWTSERRWKIEEIARTERLKTEALTEKPHA